MFSSSRVKQTHSRLTLQLDSADRDIYFRVIMVARPFRFHSPDASTHLILSDEINGDWEQFSVTVRDEKYHVWLHDRWRYFSLKSRLQQKLSDVPEDEQLLSVLTDFFRQYPSEYACILIGSGKTVALVDHMRSVPLFYTRKHGECFLSDRPENLIPHMTPRLSKAELRKYLLAGYVPGRRTLLKDIYQIPAGEYVRWEKGNLRTDCYYHFWRTDSKEFAFEEQAERYRNLFLEVMDEFLRAHREQNIVLLLSGGMDSRFILWALYALAPSNRRIHLLTYGRPRRRDAGWGRRIAEVTPFQWHFVTQSFARCRDNYQSEEIKRYFSRNHYFANLPYYQEFYTLQYLQKRGFYPEGAIFINGDSGGLLSGSHLSTTPNPAGKSEEEVLRHLVGKKFNLWSQRAMSAEERASLSDCVSGTLSKAPENNRYLANLYDWWEWKETTSKFLMTAKYQIAHFGHQLYHPFWDKRLAGFFVGVPLHLRSGQEFYRRAFHKFAGELDPALLNVPVTKPGKAAWHKKFRRGFEFVTDPKWGRYSAADFSRARTVARYLLHTDVFDGLPNINGFNAGVLLWNLIQQYPVRKE